MRKIILTAMLVFSAAACTSNIENFTAISTHSIDPGQSIASAKITKNVRGEDVAHMIIIVPTATVSMSEAVSNALKENDADMLINAKTYTTFWWIPYIYGQQRYVVEGDAVKFGGGKK
ncbi:MAG: hypothetical protein LBL21_04935 [Rickettsiales bacterium]|nr:hypothetical protein [Rickettsiales bacterium]